MCPKLVFYIYFLCSFVSRIFGHALEDSCSKSALVHSLSVCTSLLDPKRSASAISVNSFRSQHLYEPPIQVDPETISAMLPKLGKLISLFIISWTFFINRDFVV